MKWFSHLCFVVLVMSLPANSQEHVAHARPLIPSADVLAKLPEDGGKEWNRLVFESSPYLLQHAANPVDWYPWGEAAFKRSRAEDKPIFLSIGYATCHWCHVMERESFEDDEVAALLNQFFVCVKVDREERPDIDEIYMSACQIMTRSGGWPLTCFLTPKLKPFYVGTYFPKRGRYNKPGMMELLPNINDIWEKQRPEVMDTANRVTQALVDSSPSEMGELQGKSVLEMAFSEMSNRYDDKLGGFGTNPKFPTPHNLTFLLRYYNRSQDARALEMVTHTLRQMRRGGIYDHVGFGFHRYSTDRQWLVPHFEKMLYDQALMALAYLETYQITGDLEFADAAREIFTYVLRDMTSPEGGFYSAEDADSEGVEGKFYLWSLDEVMALLGDKEGELWASVYQIKQAGNFVEPGAVNPGHNIPHLLKPLSEVATDMDLPEKDLRMRLEASRKKLFEVREKRVHAFKDDKILTDWNGLMIAALARGARVLDDKVLQQAAVKAAEFTAQHLRTKEGRLLKRYRLGKAGLPAHLDDYAFLCWGLIELYQTTFEVRFLEEAVQLGGSTLNYFWDSGSGGFFLTANDSESLITRSKTSYDGAIPSGNSVAASNLIMLSRLTASDVFAEMSSNTLKAFSKGLTTRPSSSTFFMNTLDFELGPSYEVVVVGKKGAPDTRKMLKALRSKYLPSMVVLFKPVDDPNPITKIAPFLAEYTWRNKQATAYVCQNFTCQLPTNDVAKMLKDLGVALAK